MVNQETDHSLECIAIVGMAGCFPGAETIEQFWQNLCDGAESITFLTDDELIPSGLEPALLDRPNYVKAAALLTDVETFDAAFFGFTPREAELMDPQQRRLLECAWSALEDAGYEPGTNSGLTGVYTGANLSNYLIHNLQSRDLSRSPDIDILISNDKDFIPTQIAYKLNLKGPSLNISTACSSSLVAVHQACRALLGYECDMALAGGISIQVPHRVGYLHQHGSILSPDGHCRAFDSAAQGTIFGSGMGMVVLKRLEDAVADGDCIRAVIRGSAINNDGALKAGYTAPSVEGQAAAIAAALAFAEVEPETITYIEAHGTGTALGDPIELRALNHVFRAQTNKTGFCAIGSVKTNVGHLNTAAGITGLIKTVLALQHQQIPASLHFQQPNPQIDFANSPFYVNTTLTDWHANGTTRRAGVSSFGIGGTNAHVVLEEAPVVANDQSPRSHHLLLLSAKTETALETATVNLLTHLKQHPELNLADVAYTLQTGRRSFAHRRMMVCHSVDEAVQRLESGQHATADHTDATHRAIAFLFPGQGSQYVGMGQDLYETEPVFREQVDRCCELLKPFLEIDLCAVLYPTERSEQSAVSSQQSAVSGRKDIGDSKFPHPSSFILHPSTSLLTQTQYAQPALFAIEYALAQLWLSWGVQPEALLGHSIGELVAACLAGVFSLEDALSLVALRGRLMQDCPTGTMLSVPLSEAELQPWLCGELTLAAHNAPSLSVVSGTEVAIAHLQTCLSAQGIESRCLQTSHAFHSPLMENVVEPFVEAVCQVQLHPPQIPVISNVTGTWLSESEATDPHYWGQQLRQTVRFAEGIKTLVQQSRRILLEVGPGRTLSTLAKQQASPEQLILTSLRHPQEQQSDMVLVLQTLGQLWLAGVEIAWTGFYAQEQRRRVLLPTYPFERQRYWIEPSRSQNVPTNPLDRKPDIADWFYLPSWKRAIAPQRFAQIMTDPLCWLVFVDQGGLGQQLAERLQQVGQMVITVQAAEQFSQVSDSAYTLNPQQPKDYETLLQVLHTSHQSSQRIVHFWGTNTDDGVKLIQKNDFYSLIYLIQALTKHLEKTSLRLDVITSNLQDVVGTEPLMPQKLPILGACKVTSQEYPDLACRTIDVSGFETDSFSKNHLIEQLLAELAAPATDAIVAYRGSHRWVQTFEPVRLSAATPDSSRLKRGGVYLIAGDLVDGLGLAFAQSLVETWQANVALVGQTGIPERHVWEQWLTTHAADDPVSRRIRQVQTLEMAGAQLLLFEADVTDVNQMEKAIAQIDNHFGELHGIIYTPAINAAKFTRSIQEIIPTSSESELRSPVQGLQVLTQVLQGKRLDFGVVQSLASVVGGLGLAAYTAGYVWLDAWVNQLNRTSLTPWFSLNRQAWHSDWEVEQPVGKRDRVSDLAMSPSEVWEAIERILAMDGVNQMVVSTADLAARLEHSLLPQSVAAQDELVERSLAPHSRPRLNTPYAPPQTETEQAVAAIWQELLGLQQIGIHDNFFELGGHSLLAVQVLSRLREQFQMELPLKSLLFDAPTIAGIANLIAQHQSDAITPLVNSEAIAPDQMEQLLSEIESLSPEVLQARLAQHALANASAEGQAP